MFKENELEIQYLSWPSLGSFRSPLHNNHKSFPSAQGEGTRHPVQLPVETRIYSHPVTMHEEGEEPLSRISAMITTKHRLYLPLPGSDKKELPGSRDTKVKVPNLPRVIDSISLYLNHTVHC